MPQHKSAAKRMRSSERRRIRNRANKSRMKTMIKELRGAKDTETAEKAYRNVSSLLDRLAAKRVIHANAAANRKSKLAKFIKTLG